MMSFEVTVWPDRYIKGLARGWPVVDLVEALETEYVTDAHFVPYVLKGSKVTPRINKTALVDPDLGLVKGGGQMLMTALVFDIDDKGHDPARHDWLCDQEDRLEGLCDQWYECRGYYETRGGYRLLWGLGVPMVPAEWDKARQKVMRCLLALGVEPDDLKDAQRCYRLPSVCRDGVMQRPLMDIGGLEAGVIDLSAFVEPAGVFADIANTKAHRPLTKAVSGGRNTALMRVMGMFRRAGADEQMMRVHARAHNEHFCEPPLEGAEVGHIVDSLMRYDADDEAADALRFELGDDAEISCVLVERLALDGEMVADRDQLWQYDDAEGIWAVYEPQRMTRAVMALSGCWVRAGQNKDGTAKYKPLKVSRALCDSVYALICAKKHRRGYFDLAAAGLMFTNGLLKVGDAIELQPADPDWRQVSKMEMAWDADAKCPLFDRLLTTSLSSACARLFGQWCGVALLGRATDFGQGLILYGEGANGKSTLLDVYCALVADDALASIPPQLMDNEYRRAALSRCRVNVVNELPAADLLRSEQVKAIISGDAIDARHIRGQPFRFRPRAGHVFAANDLPGVRDMSEGFWRRWLIIPFDRIFAPHEQDKELAAKIIASELPGVVAWFVRCALDAIKAGRFAVPTESIVMRDRWRHEADRVSMFLEERASSKPGYTAASILHQVFLSWCNQGGYRALNQTNFGKRLKRLGIGKKRTSGGWHYSVLLEPVKHLSLVP